MFKILDEKCTPKKGTKFSACVDLFAREDVVIGAGETVLVPLGVKIDKDFVFDLPEVLSLKKMHDFAIEVDKNEDIKPWKEVAKPVIETFLKSHQLNLHIRSSMSAKHGLVIANGTGIIDLDYTGEIMICLHNPWDGQYANQDFLNQHGFLQCDAIKKKFTIKKGQPIAQISLVEHKTYLLGVKSEEKRTGGFGSTNA